VDAAPGLTGMCLSKKKTFSFLETAAFQEVRRAHAAGDEGFSIAEQS
jgi:hypothetical protein